MFALNLTQSSPEHVFSLQQGGMWRRFGSAIPTDAAFGNDLLYN
jgi:hypothetical protein